MDAFFGGLDSRLRASVKVADSIMVGLVNAAMEDAYKKSLWKDGDLECLFQKLRFAELAIMQLEWCLRFVRGEMEADGGADDEGHERLLDDLLETRDRIQARLDEAELAVAEKDRDYMRRKHEDQLSPSRRKTASADRRDVAEEGSVFGELKDSVDRKMSRMRVRLEDARSTLAALMQKVSGEASPMARLQEAGHEGDGVKRLSGFYTMAQLLMEFQEMVLDAGAVRDSVASSFDAMESSVPLLRTAMEEQQWLMDAEKEIYGTVVEGFLREINVESKCTSSPGEGSHPPTLHQHSDATENSPEECEYLKDENKQMGSTRRIPAEETSDSRERYHSEERGISREETEKLTEEMVHSEIRCELQDVLYSAIFRDLVRKLNVQKLTEEREEVDITSKLHCEIYSTMFKELVKKQAVESAEHLVRTFIEDEVQVVFVVKILNEWKSTAETVQNEGHIKEEIDCIVFGGVIKDLIHSHNLSLLKSPDEGAPNYNLGQFSRIDKIKQLQKVKMQINMTTEDGGVDSDQDKKLVKQETLGMTDNCDRQNSKESDPQAETSTYNYKDGVSDSTSGNVEEGLEYHRKLQTGEVALSFSMLLEGANQKNAHTALDDEKQAANNLTVSNAISCGQSQFELQKSLFIPLTNFQEMFDDFQAVACGKVRTSVLRLGDLDKQLANLDEQVSSLKRSELVYRKAFTRRCYDLQTAEAEVDLLGDEVELLLGLLRKTYKALDHYSPVLQHYPGIMEMLSLLGKELAVRHQILFRSCDLPPTIPRSPPPPMMPAGDASTRAAEEAKRAAGEEVKRVADSDAAFEPNEIWGFLLRIWGFRRRHELGRCVRITDGGSSMEARESRSGDDVRSRVK
ncbi:uncharacterized protein LOC133925552 [Phragmites australis]|uniref:uncharacterized protein LOC133925552 n=1 Tax=Phragmites australis TaxID=29695 RepID=UPI002D778A63|nr:uncharacterized protein LOC133925552 [Phragmites australis]